MFRKTYYETGCLTMLTKNKTKIIKDFKTRPNRKIYKVSHHGNKTKYKS